MKWPRQALRAKKQRGVSILFWDAEYTFYETVFRSPKTGTERRLLFRVRAGKDYMDRFHWWFCQEQQFTNIPKSYNIVRVEKPKVARIQKWMDSHIWTFMQKGFPAEIRWLKKIDPAEYEKQKRWLSKQPLRKQRYELDLKTLSVEAI